MNSLLDFPFHLRRIYYDDLALHSMYFHSDDEPHEWFSSVFECYVCHFSLLETDSPRLNCCVWSFLYFHQLLLLNYWISHLAISLFIIDSLLNIAIVEEIGLNIYFYSDMILILILILVFWITWQMNCVQNMLNSSIHPLLLWQQEGEGMNFFKVNILYCCEGLSNFHISIVVPCNLIIFIIGRMLRVYTLHLSNQNMDNFNILDQQEKQHLIIDTFWNAELKVVVSYK